MFKHILIATDGSELSERAIRLGVDVAKAVGAKVTAVMALRHIPALYYDVAGTAYRPAIAALTTLVPATQILFGSDNPFVPLSDTAEGIRQLSLSRDDLARIDQDNALTLLPRFKAAKQQ